MTMTDERDATIIETWWAGIETGTVVPDIHDMLAYWGAACWACGKRLNHHTATRDHLLPQTRGGSNDITNVAPACPACNNEKGNRTPLEWLGDRCPEPLRDVSQNLYRPIPDYASAADTAQLVASDFDVTLTNEAAEAIAQAVAVHLTLHPPTSAASRLSAMLRSCRNRIDRQGRRYAAVTAERDALANVLAPLVAAHDDAASGGRCPTDSQLLDLAHDAVLTWHEAGG